MKINFFKYQATGNDFVILDNRDLRRKFSKAEIERICDRRFGVGADGLMLIEPDSNLDFNLVYYNSDGSQSLCGNGSRAAVAFAATLGLVNGKTSFNAYDGLHEAVLLPNGEVRLRMSDVSGIEQKTADFFINTGSPHYVRFVENVKDYEVFTTGREIRYSEEFKPGGTNVNFVQLLGDNAIFVRTYERGVENETLSCGTGVTAAALAASFRGYKSPITIKTLGGQLSVEFTPVDFDANTGQAGTFANVFLVGPAKMVFSGELEL